MRSNSSCAVGLGIVLAALVFFPAAASAGSGLVRLPEPRCGSFRAVDVNDEGQPASYTHVRVTSSPHLSCKKAMAVIESFWSPTEEIIAHEGSPEERIESVETLYTMRDWPGWTCMVLMPLRSHGNQGECYRRERSAGFYFGKV